MRDLGCHVGLLSTGIYNWYRGMGWERADVQRTYRLDRSTIDLLPTLPANHADNLGALRTPELFHQFLQAKTIAEGMVAHRDGRMAAYLLIKGHNVVEWSEAADLVASLVRVWFARLDDPDIGTSDRDADMVTDVTLRPSGPPLHYKAYSTPDISPTP